MRSVAPSCSLFDKAAAAENQPQQREEVGADKTSAADTVAPEQEVDPLDAFMADIEQQQKQPSAAPKAPRTDIDADEDQEDPLDVYLQSLANQQQQQESEQVHEVVDEDEERERREHDKHMPLLPAPDHASIKYHAFRRDLLVLHADIAKMSADDVAKARQKLGVQVHGRGRMAAPALCFGHLGIGDRLVEAASDSGFEAPTPIQAQAVPIALSGRDLIGVASTGSGKTAAFVWPMLVHVSAQAARLPVARGAGPIALVLAPTRELAAQIYAECRKYVKALQRRAPKEKRWRVVPLCGGMNMYEQKQALQGGCELVVATPGRLMDHLRKHNLSCDLITMVVIDEADRLLALGFEAQVRAILAQVRPDRHTLLFSATFKKRVEALARSLLRDPLRVAIGKIGAASADVTQHVVMLEKAEQRHAWLMSRIFSFLGRGQTLIFAGSRLACDELARAIADAADVTPGVIHGQKTQAERLDVLRRFKKGELRVVVASDVASRGLDVAGLATVVNFELARDVDAHVHRIGRTGRAGQQHAGTAFTLLAPDLPRAACRALPNVLRSIADAAQTVPDAAWALAARHYPADTAKARAAASASAAASAASARGARGGGATRPAAPASAAAAVGGAASLRQAFAGAFVKAALAAPAPGGDDARPAKRSRWGR